MSEGYYLQIKSTTPYYNAIRKLAFPSMTGILASLALVNAIGGLISFYIYDLHDPRPSDGLLLGIVVLTIPSLGADLFSHYVFLRDDELFYLRRCLALSFFSCLLWILVLVVGALVGIGFPNFIYPDYAFYLGFFALVPIRFLSIFSMSSATPPKAFFFSILQPLACLASEVVFRPSTVFQGVGLFAVSVAIASTYTYVLLNHVEKDGGKRIGISPIQLFRAFLIDWLDRRNESFEGLLEELGDNQRVSVNLLKFRGVDSGYVNSAIVVSNFHPGPFLNVGSSVLPYLIQKSMSGRFGVTLVPHGISGHELNLTSQRQNQAVLDKVVRLAESNSYSRKASKLVRSRVGDAKASCQIFGDCALVTLSLSPRDMEDIPIETGNTIRECAKEYFRSVAVVDAHNSISEPTVIPKEELDGLIEAGKIAIADAARQPRREFEVGASSSVLERFSLAEGIGPGGISAFVVKVQDQLVAYLTIDGNNMISGLRETVLKAMSDLGIEEGEIMTTDTHMVNGVVPARLGYHPIGEAVDISVLIENLDRIVKDAKSRLSPVEVSCTSGEVGVKTLGLKTFRNITAFMYNAVRIVVYSVPPLILLPTLIFLILLV